MLVLLSFVVAQRQDSLLGGWREVNSEVVRLRRQTWSQVSPSAIT